MNLLFAHGQQLITAFVIVFAYLVAKLLVGVILNLIFLRESALSAAPAGLVNVPRNLSHGGDLLQRSLRY